MAGSATEEGFRARAAARRLLNLAAELDYAGLREAFFATGGIAGIPTPPPEALPPMEKVEAQQKREEAEFREEFERTEAAGVDDKYRITPMGEDGLRTHRALKRWLEERPGGPPRPDSLVREAIGPLLGGWSGRIFHAIAAAALTLDELAEALPELERANLETQIEWLARSGQVEAGAEGGETRYGLTEWGRAAVAPLLAAVLYERRHERQLTLPPDVSDVETAFQMALPLLRLAPWMRGECRLGAQILGGAPLMAGATVRIDAGRVVSATPLLDESPETWITGDTLAWCERVIDPSAGKLHAGGDTELTDALIAALHERLFGGEDSGPPRLADLL